MDIVYIVAIAAGALFLVLLICFICRQASATRKAKAEKARLIRYYSDPNLARMDYDVANFTIRKRTDADQVSIFDIIPAEGEGEAAESFEKFCRDEEDEIVGTYEED